MMMSILPTSTETTAVVSVVHEVETLELDGDEVIVEEHEGHRLDKENIPKHGDTGCLTKSLSLQQRKYAKKKAIRKANRTAEKSKSETRDTGK